MHQRIASFARGIALVLVALLGYSNTAQAAAVTEQASAPAPVPAAEVQCLPKCHGGYHCVDGLRCVRDCDPPCAANEICDADRRCVVSSDATAVSTPPVAATSTATVAHASPQAAVAAEGPPASAPAAQNAQAVPRRNNTSSPSPPDTTSASMQIGDPSLYAVEPPATPETEKNGPNRLGRDLLFLLSVDSLVGYESSWFTITPTQHQGTPVSGVEASNDSKFVSLFGGRGSSLFPQLAVDRAILPCFTVGAVLSYVSFDGGETTWTNSSGAPRKNGSYSSYAIGGRIGYLFMLSEHWGIWPKVALSYWSSSQTTYSYSVSTSATTAAETISETDQHAVLLTPGISLVASPVQHFGFLLGLNVPFAIGGGYSYLVNGATVHEGDFSIGTLGISAGLLGYL